MNVAITKKQREVEKNRILDNMIYPWSQQPNESGKNFSLFLKYLGVGRTRNYAKVSELCEMKYSMICRIANEQNWKVRAEKHDVVVEEEFKCKLDEEIIQSRIRQQRVGSEMVKIAEKGLLMLDSITDELTPQEIVKLAEIGSKIENLALGSATEIKNTRVEAEVSVQVEKIPKEIAEKIGKELAIKSSEEMINND